MAPAQAKEITMASAQEQEKISMAWHFGIAIFLKERAETKPKHTFVLNEPCNAEIISSTF
jgi:hypothetical protein